MGADNMPGQQERGKSEQDLGTRPRFTSSVSTKTPGEVSTEAEKQKIAEADTKNKVIGPSAQEVEDAVAGTTAERNKKIGKSNLGRSVLIGTSILGGAAVAGIGAYEVYQNVPAFHRSAENIALFDRAKLDTEKQTINPQYATEEDIKDTINGHKPKIVSFAAVEAGEEMPKIPLILSIGQEAGKIKIYRVPTKVGLNGKSVDIFMNLRISVENEGARFGPAIPEGINTNEGEVFLAPGPNNTVIDGKLHFTTMYIKYKFDSDKYMVVVIGSNMPKSLIATDFLKDAPTIKGESGYEDSSGQIILGESFDDKIRKTTGKKFNISDNPTLFVNTSSEDINIQISSSTEDLKGYALLPELKDKDGNILINSMLVPLIDKKVENR